MGLDWGLSDTALTIMNPAYGLYRLFGGKAPGASDDDGVSTDKVRDITQTDAYKALLARQQALSTRGAAAETRRQAALQALQALRSAPAASYTPIAVNVPSFSLGSDW